MSAIVFVCLGCERHETRAFTCGEPPECEAGGDVVSMSVLAWEIRNVEAALLGIQCQKEMRGGKPCRRNGTGFQCCKCAALRSARVCMNEIAKAEPLPRVRALRRRAS